jgi:hypothetical protein
MCAGGPGTAASYVTACGWFLVATTSLRGIHLHRAQSGYERASSHLTAAQIVKARGFAQGWKPKRPNGAAALRRLDNT